MIKMDSDQQVVNKELSLYRHWSARFLVAPPSSPPCLACGPPGPLPTPRLGGLVFKAHRLFVSPNSRLEINKEEEEDHAWVGVRLGFKEEGSGFRVQISGFGVSGFRILMGLTLRCRGKREQLKGFRLFYLKPLSGTWF